MANEELMTPSARFAATPTTRFASGMLRDPPSGGDKHSPVDGCDRGVFVIR